MNFEPTGHYVAIKPDPTELEKMTSEALAGFEIVGSEGKREQSATTSGKVLAVGPEAWVAFPGEKPWAEVGDDVYFVRHTQKEIVEDDETYFIIVDENIIARKKNGNS
jgi:co-chaperonin GroES (HSP10)